MTSRWPEITDMDSLHAWVRSRGFEPDDYKDWDYEIDGPPPWSVMEWAEDGLSYTFHFPLIVTEPRVLGRVTNIGD